jgi:hypothetical protein
VASRREVLELPEALLPYVEMIRAFVSGRLDLPEFEDQFNAMYLNATTRLSGEAFRELDGFFSDIDSCVPRAEQPNPKFREITLEELRERAIGLLLAGGYEA